MRVEATAIPDVKVVRPQRFGDDRGWFSETYRADRLEEAGVAAAFVQDNQSFSAPAGTVRGLHFQLAPAAQAKLVRVLAGAILDVAVDLRRASPTFGRHVALRLDAAGGEQLFVPAGFAHGFCTLEPDTMVAYKVDAYYSPEHDRALLWNDPALAIPWPVSPETAILSAKDSRAPTLAGLLAALPAPF
ncbi:dTDP-4-dehydrorhamnose 3,5-epimerase [Methylobacterium soli]|uniref:dTDP-4-dehydrorhamnose 3,5-epimerase n=1 Tax=Methylobacterium soli TaxID=553447 RepID=A0A6L3T5B6_9HYPH|nr:dTDP-4-dehydrorhamnose 3,5-epimerase [Methylobacterium soli]KAB1081216.1 dTDP-4-dehydrorhamnose 3,5-epimerase [Methylobacterium soli]GJE43434.1 dTDP-4-dehydrorhamnose 3,5-epimerase [Methylobacterium soli]